VIADVTIDSDMEPQMNLSLSLFRLQTLFTRRAVIRRRLEQIELRSLKKRLSKRQIKHGKLRLNLMKLPKNSSRSIKC